MEDCVRLQVDVELQQQAVDDCVRLLLDVELQQQQQF
jgi:hypothetical protein